MSDKEAEFMEQRAGLNEPPPEEPARFDGDPYVAEALRKRDELRRQVRASQANSEMLIGALRENLEGRK